MVSNAEIIGDIVLIQFVWECTKVTKRARLDVISINGEVIEYVNTQKKLLLLYWWFWLTINNDNNDNNQYPVAVL